MMAGLRVSWLQTGLNLRSLEVNGNVGEQSVLFKMEIAELCSTELYSQITDDQVIMVASSKMILEPAC